MTKLTEQEKQVLRHAGDGLTAQETAVKMGLAVATVRTYRSRILIKTEARNMAQAVAMLRGKR